MIWRIGQKSILHPLRPFSSASRKSARWRWREEPWWPRDESERRRQTLANLIVRCGRSFPLVQSLLVQPEDDSIYELAEGFADPSRLLSVDGLDITLSKKSVRLVFHLTNNLPGPHESVFLNLIERESWRKITEIEVAMHKSPCNAAFSGSSPRETPHVTP